MAAAREKPRCVLLTYGTARSHFKFTMLFYGLSAIKYGSYLQVT